MWAVRNFFLESQVAKTRVLGWLDAFNGCKTGFAAFL